tara:strand:+ start:785 stop:952 length:168 start_codon:yes stop_codon:yes gene_type:complete
MIKQREYERLIKEMYNVKYTDPISNKTDYHFRKLSEPQLKLIIDTLKDTKFRALK